MVTIIVLPMLPLDRCRHRWITTRRCSTIVSCHRWVTIGIITIAYWCTLALNGNLDRFIAI